MPIGPIGPPADRADRAAGGPGGRRACGPRRLQQLQDFQQTTRVPGPSLYTKPQQEDVLKKKVAEGHFFQRQDFHQTTRLSTDYKSPCALIVHKAPTRRRIKTKVAEGHFFPKTRVSKDYNSFNRLQQFQQMTIVSTDSQIY